MTRPGPSSVRAFMLCGMLAVRNVVDLQVGDIGFTVIPGRVGGVISLGQWLIDAANLLRGKGSEGAWFTHAYMVVRREGESAFIIEAMPKGARIVMLKGMDRCGRDYGWARVAMTEEQGRQIGSVASALEGTPYSFLDYLSLALLHLGLPRRLTAGRVASSGHMICSQLVDHLLCRVGIHLFDDGRLSQDVTPGALFRRVGGIGEVVWW